MPAPSAYPIAGKIPYNEVTWARDRSDENRLSHASVISEKCPSVAPLMICRTTHAQSYGSRGNNHTQSTSADIPTRRAGLALTRPTMRA